VDGDLSGVEDCLVASRGSIWRPAAPWICHRRLAECREQEKWREKVRRLRKGNVKLKDEPTETATASFADGDSS